MEISNGSIGGIIGAVIIIIIFVVVFVVIKPSKKGSGTKAVVSPPTPAPTPPAPVATAAPGPIAAAVPQGVSPSGQGVPRCTAVPNDPNSYICESYTDGTLVTSKIIQ